MRAAATVPTRALAAAAASRRGPVRPVTAAPRSEAVPHPTAPLPAAACGSAAQRAAAAEILARTLLGETAGRPVRAVEAVAAVVMNRVRLAAALDGPAHWGRGVAGVCRAPFQFACWTPHHPRHRAMLEAAAGGEAGAFLALCRRVAARAAAGALPDPTGGAAHYHPAESLPRWALGEAPTAEIGGLVFYRLDGAAAAATAQPATGAGRPAMATAWTRR